VEFEGRLTIPETKRSTLSVAENIVEIVE